MIALSHTQRRLARSYDPALPPLKEGGSVALKPEDFPYDDRTGLRGRISDDGRRNGHWDGRVRRLCWHRDDPAAG